MKLVIAILLHCVSLCAADTLTIVACEWPPFTGSKLEKLGLLSELAVTALEKSGYTVKLQIIPWARAVKLTENGRADALLGASYLKEREKWAIYPEIIYTSNSHFFTQSDRLVKFTSFKALAPATISLLNGSNFIQELSLIPGLQLENVNSVDLNFKKVAYKRVDYSIEALPVINYTLSKELPELKHKIAVVNPSFAKDNLYLIFSRGTVNSARKVAAFNKGLKEIKKDGTYQKIVDRHLPELP